MSIIKQPYNGAKVGHIRQLLLNNAQAGKPVDYEIRVDDLKVIPRTNDPEQFDDHEEFITEDTGSVLFILYDGTSRRSTRHLFLLKQKTEEPKPVEKEPGLSGVEVDKLINDKLREEKRQWQYEQLEKENQQLQKQLEEAETYMEKLENQLLEAQGKRKLSDMNWGEIASVAAEALIRRNSHLIAKIPGGEGLAGVIKQDTIRQSSTGTDQEYETTFTRVESEEEHLPVKESVVQSLSEEDQAMVGFLRQLEERFDQQEMKQVITLLNLLADNPELIVPVLELIHESKEGNHHQKDAA